MVVRRVLTRRPASGVNLPVSLLGPEPEWATFLPMREILELIDEVLTERRWSARQVSIEAIGTPNIISNMRRGQEPSIGRMRALCDVLGLEIYIGRPRVFGGQRFDVARPALAIDAVEEGLPDAGRHLSTHERSQLVVAVYELLDERDPSASAGRIRELLAIAVRFGVADAVREDR